MMLLSCQWHWEQDKAIGSLLPVMVHHILFVVAPIFLSLFFINCVWPRWLILMNVVRLLLQHLINFILNFCVHFDSCPKYVAPAYLFVQFMSKKLSKAKFLQKFIEFFPWVIDFSLTFDFFFQMSNFKPCLRINVNALHLYNLGLPKSIWVSCFKLQTWDWPKIWMYTKFRVPRSMFYHIPRSLKTPSQGHFKVKQNHFKTLT